MIEGSAMIRASRRILFGIGVLALLPAAVFAQTAPLVGDAFIQPGSASNFGGTVNVNVGGVLGQQGLFLFDLTKLPAGTTAAGVSSASLRLFVNKVGAAGAINVYAATASWTESTVNGLAGGPLPGGLVAGPIGVSIAGSYVSIPVTSQVQSWLLGAPNNGFLLQANPTSTSVFFDSKESSNTSHPAVLEIVLVPPVGSSGASGVAGAAGATGATGPGGATGPKGDTGAAGTTGVAGAAGATGPVGPAGATGAPGATGLAGNAGAGGAIGPTGPNGPTGSQGASGSAGSAGAQGPTGPRGALGSSGAQGAQGPTGPTGTQGLIQNNFAISPVQAVGAISGALTQSVILLNNTSASVVNFTLPSASTSGKDIWVDGNDFSLTTGINMHIFPATGDALIVKSVVVCTTPPAGLTCTAGNTFFPIDYRMHVVSDGNHHWYGVRWQ